MARDYLKRKHRKEKKEAACAKRIAATKVEIDERIRQNLPKPNLADLLTPPSFADLLAQPDPLVQGMLEGAAVKKGAQSDAARSSQ